MRSLLLLTLCILSFSVIGQYDIDIKLDGYENDTLISGYYLGDRQLVLDTLYATKKGAFELKADTSLTHGFYLLLTLPDNQLIQFIIDEDQEFQIDANVSNLGDVKFKGSTDNELFSNYVSFLNVQRPRAEALRVQKEGLEASDPKLVKIQAELDEVDRVVQDEQMKIIDDYPESFTSKLLKSNLVIDIPEFEGTPEEIQVASYLYYKEHYFDHIQLDDPKNLRTPFLDQRVKYYMEKLTPNHPDSLILSIDHLLAKMEPAPETYRYYLSSFLNQYAKSKIVGMDAIYVHLVDKYYTQGKADWVDEENMVKLVENANDIRPVLIGKTAQDITVYKEDGTEVTLSELEYEYLVLLFWAPDCGHCKKSMPSILEFYEKYKDKGVKLLAICTKHTDKVPSCWEHIKEKGMEGFINAADEYHKSRFKTKFNVKSTPKIYILNPEREILIKDIGGEQLDRVMEEIYKRVESERLEENGK